MKLKLLFKKDYLNWNEFIVVNKQQEIWQDVARRHMQERYRSIL